MRVLAATLFIAIAPYVFCKAVVLIGSLLLAHWGIVNG